MKKVQRWIHLALFFSLITTSAYAQEICQQEEREEIYDLENHTNCSAYMESSHTAHWTVYIPLTILVAAAIYFGVADKKNHGYHCSGSQDALGSIVNSKRIGSLKRSSSSYKSYSYYRSRMGYQHS